MCNQAKGKQMYIYIAFVFLYADVAFCLKLQSLL